MPSENSQRSAAITIPYKLTANPPKLKCKYKQRQINIRQAKYIYVCTQKCVSQTGPKTLSDEMCLPSPEKPETQRSRKQTTSATIIVGVDKQTKK